MSNLININKGFEAMIPKSPEGEEVTSKKEVNHELTISLFGIQIALSFKVTRS